MKFLLALSAAFLLGSAPASTGQTQEAGDRIEFFTPSESGPETIAETTVGMRVTLTDFVIPGSAVRAKPVVDPGRADALVRIKHEYTHGAGFRYDLEVTPFVEGDLDLADYLERKDGTSMDDVPELSIFVEAMLDPSVLQPKDPDVPQPGKVGGYRKLLWVVGAAWVLGLLLLIFAFRRKPESDLEGAGVARLSLADRLRPLVEEARKSELSNERRAELERLLVAHWRKRRGLEDVPAAEAVAQLRSDEEAGPLLRQLEEWLHRPVDAGRSAVDVAALLAPYEHVSADEALGLASGEAAHA